MGVFTKILREVIFHIGERKINITLKGVLKLILYACVIEVFVILMERLWHYRKYWFFMLVGTIVGIWAIIKTNLYIYLLIGLGLALVITASIILWRKIKAPLIWKSIVAVGVCISIAVTGIFCLKTIDISRPNNIVAVSNFKHYIDDGVFSRDYYIGFGVLPTQNIKPDTNYQIITTCGKLSWVNNINWSQVELNYDKMISVKNQISPEEYNVLTRNPVMNYRINEVVPEHNFLWWLIPIGYVGLIYLVYRLGLLKAKTEFINNKEQVIDGVYTEVNDDQDFNDDFIKRCFSCGNLKMKNGAMRCEKEGCAFDKRGQELKRQAV